MPPTEVRHILKAALTRRSSGRFVEAARLYREALDQAPADPDTLHLLGALYGELGRSCDAIELIERAISIRSNVARYHSDLGNVLGDLGRLTEAIASYQRAIELEPLGSMYHSNLGTVLRDSGRRAEAMAEYHRAIALDPQSAQAHNNLGVALTDEGRLEDAVACFGRAIHLKRDYADAHTNLGIALYALGKGDEAVAACRRAVELSPSFAKAHSNLALILLGTGNYREGWREHEWRWKCNPAFRPRSFPQPNWDGAPLEAKTILLHAEQGFGDTIQFARYVPLLAQRGGRVILECQPALARLFQSLPGPATVIPSGHPLPAFDTHCSLMSLPHALREDAIPADIPHLRPSSRLVRAWEEKLVPSPGKRIGLVWAGRPTHSNDRNRSVPPEHLAVLATVPEVEWHSLQKNPPAGLAPELRIIDHSSDLNDFADTAALIANLDLVISVDTAVAHLAGAMGKPTWLLLPFTAEWRWMLNRDDSPWYPTMRLFRQPEWGDWPGVMRRVEAALQSIP
ncbi:MAG TPA: tetratricopeptide repeat-containing glycosyltransferase family protein [Tepidisphaeraceae bacterium]|nr:tetratricopeptide repeat-containing glycosyltransferase family protein [Tepidisphaeraceae bacterium]